MLENIEDIVSKYDSEVFAKLNKENMTKIIIFLQKENCDFIEDLLNDYIDLFIIEYDDFIRRYIILNEKYNYKYLELAAEDMNYLEEMYDCY
ncbi:MAG TPA: hypothetical protein OIM63_03720 [Bacilli bacterium]|jgi:hypothetical protein|nr:hypothetical protein [Bacilli bacterium]